MPDADVLIVGAGLAGLSCAQALTAAGKRVTVVERSRFVGGRAASKAPEEGEVADFGPVFVHGDDPEFLAWVETFDPLEGWPHRVVGTGTPCQPQAFDPLQRRFGLKQGIRRLAEELATGLDVVTGVEVQSLTWGAEGVEVVSAGRRFSAQDGVLATALEQNQGLLRTLLSGPGSSVVRSADALLGQFASLPSLVVVARYDNAPALAWDLWYPEASPSVLLISNEGAKRLGPGGRQALLVIQARPRWSADRLDADRDQWTQELLAEASRLIGPWVNRPSNQVSHRWRFARLGPADHLVRPLLLERPGSVARWGLVGDLFDPDGGLQGAWRSGRRLAVRI